MDNYSLPLIFSPQNNSLDVIDKLLTRDRRKLAETIMADIQSIAGSQSSNHHLIIGPRGSGKTHLLAYIRHSIPHYSQNDENVLIIPFSEEERGISSLLDFIMTVICAAGEARTTIIEKITGLTMPAALELVTEMLEETINQRAVLLIIENLNDIFTVLQSEGQIGPLRGFLQTHSSVSLLASATSKYQNGKEDHPFYGFFNIHTLRPLSPDGTQSFLASLASANGNPQLAIELNKETAIPRINAVYDLTGGNHRLLAMLSIFLDDNGLANLVPPFICFCDRELTPYYQQRLDRLSPQQNKILRAIADHHGRAIAVKEIARYTILTSQVVSRQLTDLHKGEFVRKTQVGRTTCYELNEPLLRLMLDIKEGRNRPLPLIVNFLQRWYDTSELQHRIIDAQNESLTYYSAAITKTEFDAIDVDFLKKHSARITPDNIDILLQQAVLLAAHEKTQQKALSTVNELGQLIATQHGTNTDLLTGKITLARGLILVEMNQIEAAAATFETAIREFEKNQDSQAEEDLYRAKLYRAMILCDLNRTEEAIDDYDNLISALNNSDSVRLQELAVMAMINRRFALVARSQSHLILANSGYMQKAGKQFPIPQRLKLFMHLNDHAYEDANQLLVRTWDDTSPGHQDRVAMICELIDVMFANPEVLKEFLPILKKDYDALISGLILWIQGALPISERMANNLKNAEILLPEILINVPGGQTVIDILKAVRLDASGNTRALLELPLEIRHLITHNEKTANGPLLVINIVGFSSIYKTEFERMHVIKVLQSLIDFTGEMISPYTPFSRFFKQTNSINGYYLFLENQPIDTAFVFVKALCSNLYQYNTHHNGVNTPLRLCLILAWQRTDLDINQYADSLITDAQHLVRDEKLKSYQEYSDGHSILFSTAIFHNLLESELTKSPLTSKLTKLNWSQLQSQESYNQDDIAYVNDERITSETGIDDDKTLQRYLAAIHIEHGRINLFGFLSSANISVNLFDAFVSLRLTEYGHSLPEIKEPKEETERLLSPRQLLTQAMADSKSILILGDPGSGKTTLMRYLEICSIDNSGQNQLSLKKPLIPLLVPLREINPDQPFIESLVKWAKIRNFNFSKRTLKNWLKEPGILVLLDGLDEVGSLKKRKQICRWIDHAVPVYNQSVFVVTCRFTGYHEHEGIFLKLPHIRANVLDLNSDQQQEYLLHWFYAVSIAELDPAERSNEENSDSLKKESATHANDIITFLAEDGNRSLKEMAGIPVLLQIMAIIWREHGSLAGGRMLLYNRSINYLLDHRDRRKRIKPLLTTTETKKILQNLSFWMQDELHADELPGKKIETYITGMLKKINPEISSAQFLNYICDRAGVLVKSNDTYMFQHKSFREYLAAVEIANRGRADLLVANFHDDWWRETILFSAGLTEPAIFPQFLELFLPHDGNDGATSPLLLQMVRESVRLPIDPIIMVLTDRRYSWRKRYNSLQCLRHHASERVITAVMSLIDDGEKSLRNLASELLTKWGVECPQDTKTAPKESHFFNSIENNAEYIFVPGGQFRFSATVKEVSISDLYIAKYPITNLRYRTFLNSFTDAEVQIHNSKDFENRKFNEDNQPVIGISWYSAMQYCQWLTMQAKDVDKNRSQRQFRLPLEMEWEWVAGRGGRRYPWGNETPNKNRANCDEMMGHTTVAGLYPDGATPEGIMDMAGNIWELCLNGWEQPDLSVIPDINQIVQSSEPDHLKALRGGSWIDGSGSCQVTARNQTKAKTSWNTIGFRVVMQLI